MISRAYCQKPKIPIVIFGNAMSGGNNSKHIRSKQQGIVDMIWKEYRKRERAGKLIAVERDEYLSTQVGIGTWTSLYGYCDDDFYLDMPRLPSAKFRQGCHFKQHPPPWFISLQTLSDTVAVGCCRKQEFLCIATSLMAGLGRFTAFLRHSIQTPITATNAASLAT